MLQTLIETMNPVIYVLGFVLKLCGFATRDVLRLRVLVASGIFCDTLFYLTLDPLLPLPAVMSFALVAINAMLILLLLWERTEIRMTTEARQLRAALPLLTAGDCRRLAAISSWRTDAGCLLTEGTDVDHLHYVLDGDFQLEKGGQTFTAAGPAFVGEIALLEGTTASATIRVTEGTTVVSFDMNRLRKLMARHPRLADGLTAAIGRDLARKTVLSVPMAPANKPTTPDETKFMAD